MLYLKINQTLGVRFLHNSCSFREMGDASGRLAVLDYGFSYRLADLGNKLEIYA